MKKSNGFFRGKFCLLLCVISLLGGCIERDILEDEDVTEKEPYSQFIGKKYRLKCNCYLTRSDTYYYIDICGRSGTPSELNKKYIGKEIRGTIIVGLLPKGSEFILKRIAHTYSDDRLIIVSPYVEIPSNNVIANALLLVNNSPYTFSFKKEYVEMVDPMPEKK